MILVTGANGMIGSYLIKKLLAEGEQVRAIKRSGSDLSLLGDAAAQVEWIEADITDIAALSDAMPGISKIYHAAALISFIPSDSERLMKVNVEGTANLMNLALDFGVKKVVHLSSISALGITKKGVPADENFLFEDRPDMYQYNRSKFHGEREVWRANAEGLATIIVSPSTVIGGGNFNNPPLNLFGIIDQGLRFYPNGSNGFVDVRDVVNICVKLMNSDLEGEKFIVSAENLYFKELIDLIAEELQVQKPGIPLNYWLRAIAWRLEYLKSLFTKQAPSVTEETLRMSDYEFAYSNEKIKSLLKYEFIPIRKTIKDTVAVYLAAKKAGRHFGTF